MFTTLTPAWQPTPALPGSPEKVSVLALRAQLRQSLWHPADAAGEACLQLFETPAGEPEPEPELTRDERSIRAAQARAAREARRPEREARKRQRRTDEINAAIRRCVELRLLPPDAAPAHEPEPADVRVLGEADPARRCARMMEATSRRMGLSPAEAPGQATALVPAAANP